MIDRNKVNEEDKRSTITALDLGWIKAENTIREDHTTEHMIGFAAKYREAKETMEFIQDFFNRGLNKSREYGNYRPVSCEFRETYIHKPDKHSQTEVEIHRCHHLVEPDTPFEKCPNCELESCHLRQEDAKIIK